MLRTRELLVGLRPLALALKFPNAVLRAVFRHKAAVQHFTRDIDATLSEFVLVLVRFAAHTQHPLPNLRALRRQFCQRLHLVFCNTAAGVEERKSRREEVLASASRSAKLTYIFKMYYGLSVI